MISSRKIPFQIALLGQTFTMLRWRLILGVCFIAGLVVLCWLDHVLSPRGMVLIPLALLLGMLATGEMLHMFRASKYYPSVANTQFSVFLTIGCVGLPIVFPSLAEKLLLGHSGWLAIGILAGLLLALVGQMRRFHPNPEIKSTESSSYVAIAGARTIKLALTSFAILYIGGLLGCVVLLRTLPSGASSNDWGMLALVSMIVVVKMGDTGAYTVGRLFGKHKMAPQLSPGKTWEGTLGGLVWSCLGAWVTLVYVPVWLGWTNDSTGQVPHWLLYGIAVGIAGILGDLAESLLKRDALVKDSGRLPGFGGILDLLDSILVAAPVAYLLWHAK